MSLKTGWGYLQVTRKIVLGVLTPAVPLINSLKSTWAGVIRVVKVFALHIPNLSLVLGTTSDQWKARSKRWLLPGIAQSKEKKLKTHINKCTIPGDTITVGWVHAQHMLCLCLIARTDVSLDIAGNYSLAILSSFYHSLWRHDRDWPDRQRDTLPKLIP